MLICIIIFIYQWVIVLLNNQEWFFSHEVSKNEYIIIIEKDIIVKTFEAIIFF